MYIYDTCMYMYDKSMCINDTWMYTYNTCTYAYYTYVYTTEITNFHMGKRNNTILEFSFCDVIYSDLSDKK